jgi:glycosyltransferase involved in cell wall biosynthesis
LWSAAAREGAAVDQPWLSVVIPAFNEALRLPTSLALLEAYLATKPAGSEVIVVDDGSTDATCDVVTEWIEHLAGLRLVQGAHCGKGAAIRAGALAARGVYVAFADADFSMPAEGFEHFAPEVAGVYDLAIGSREVPGAVRYGEPLYRHLMGRIFNKLVQLLALPGIRDTQCGFKCLRREVAIDLCSTQTIDGWGFDVELLYVARRRGYHVCEVPIQWYFVPGSRVHPIRDTVRMVRDVLAIRFGRSTPPARRDAGELATSALKHDLVGS